jgi:hypothetical protein
MSVKIEWCAIGFAAVLRVPHDGSKANNSNIAIMARPPRRTR